MHRAVGTQQAFSNTTSALSMFRVQTASSSLTTIHNAGIAAVVVLMLMALTMVLMAVGRTTLERKVDEQGKVACGTWLW